MYTLDRPLASGTFTLLPLESVHYGPGAIDSLGAVLAAHGIEREEKTDTGGGPKWRR